MARKGENIYKRKDGRWVSRHVKGYHPDGTPKYGYCYGKTYREAKEKLIGAKGTVLSGEILSLSAGKQTFGPFCDERLVVNRPHLIVVFYQILSIIFFSCQVAALIHCMRHHVFIHFHAAKEII